MLDGPTLGPDGCAAAPAAVPACCEKADGAREKAHEGDGRDRNSKMHLSALLAS